MAPRVEKISIFTSTKKRRPYTVFLLQNHCIDLSCKQNRTENTRHQTANIRWILERAMEYGKTIFICFIGYGKAFDCADHSRMCNTLRSRGVPEHLRVLIKGLYTKQEAAVRMEYGNTEWFEMRKGVRQGYILSPYLFNLYSEYILRRVGFEDNIGIKVGGRTINNLR